MINDKESWKKLGLSPNQIRRIRDAANECVVEKEKASKNEPNKFVRIIVRFETWIKCLKFDEIVWKEFDIIFIKNGVEYSLPSQGE